MIEEPVTKAPAGPEQMQAKSPPASVLEGVNAVMHSWTYERMLKVHTVCIVLAIVSGLIAGFDALRWAIFGMSIMVLLSSELANTAVERLADSMAGRKYNELAKEAKDIAAGAVICAAWAALSVQIVLLISSPALQKLGLALFKL